MSSTVSTIVTVQKFLSAFLDRLTKAKLSIEQIDCNEKAISDIRVLCTRIIQQWNALFPNSTIQSIDSLSTNTLIATKTREEVVLSRSCQQKQKLLMEIELLRSRWQHQQEEYNLLQNESKQHTSSIAMMTTSIQQLQQQRRTLLSTIASLQSQKQREESESHSLQTSKLSLLEDIFALQQNAAGQRTSIQALQAEKMEQSKSVERMENEIVLLKQELEVVRARQQQDKETLEHQRVILQGEESNYTNTRTATTVNSGVSVASVVSTPQRDLSGSATMSTESKLICGDIWGALGGRRRRHRRETKRSKEWTISKIDRVTNIFDDEAFW